MWKAKWIWGSGEASPRNEWRCFRREFEPGEWAGGQAALTITADSRYVLYMNGTLVGRGPVRSWPDELAYDTYEIGHLLKPNALNTVAVLVTHYGVSTFQYLRGRGGLIAQIDSGDGNEPLLATDEQWTTAVHAGYDRHASRISCQLPFTERYDARAWDESWTLAGFREADWAQASVIGSEDIPWKRLVPRTIPFLTEEPIYPARVDSLHAVKPLRWSAAFDLRQLFVPSSADHANNVSLCGLLATVVELDAAGELIVGSVDDGRLPLRVAVNGAWADNDSYYGGPSERYVRLALAAGRHFLLFDVTGTTHGHSFHLGFDSETAFRLLHPLPAHADRGLTAEGPVPFAAIGPFDALDIIDHQPTRELNVAHPDYKRALALGSAAELERLAEWVADIPAMLVDRQDTFTQSVWKRVCAAFSVPAQLQHAVTAGADAGIVPLAEDDADMQLIVDFGQELSGYLAFEWEASAGTVVDLYGFEYSKNGHIQHTYQLDNTLRYTCKEGRQSYLSPIRRGLRYVMLTVRGATRPLRIYKLLMHQSNYPAPQIGHFHSGDALLNEIWRMSRNTAKLCMEDTFVDCPAYEQAYWVGDARNEALIAYYAFGSRELVERCLRLVPGSRFQTPFYADQVPSGWNSVIPNWTFFWVTACHEYYSYTGDRTFAAELWPHIDYTLQHYAAKVDDNGLFAFKGWNLLDWASFEQPRDGIVTPQNMFMAKALRDGAHMAEAAGDAGGAARLRADAAALTEAINRRLWDEKRMAYLDCIHSDGRPSSTISMQSQVVALLCDIADGERKQRLIGYMEQPPESFVQIGSPFMSFFYHETLAKLGRCDLLVQDIREQYGVMVEEEASACWEMYPGSNFVAGTGFPTRSHCHAWSAGPVYFLGRYVLGVSGLTPGWTKIRVSPQLCGLAKARGSVPLPDGGRVDVSWQADSATRRFALRIAAPQGLELDAAAPEGYRLELERVVI